MDGAGGQPKKKGTKSERQQARTLGKFLAGASSSSSSITPVAASASIDPSVASVAAPSKPTPAAKPVPAKSRLRLANKDKVRTICRRWYGSGYTVWVFIGRTVVRGAHTRTNSSKPQVALLVGPSSQVQASKKRARTDDKETVEKQTELPSLRRLGGDDAAAALVAALDDAFPALPPKSTPSDRHTALFTERAASIPRSVEPDAMRQWLREWWGEWPCSSQLRSRLRLLAAFFA